MSGSLFREEVLRAQATQHLGTVRIARNPRHACVAAVAVLLAGALAAFAAWGEVTRKARVPGFLVPTTGTVHMSAPAPGHVLERRVSEGEAVRAGQVLLVVGIDRHGPGGQTAALVGHSLRERLAALESEGSLRVQHHEQRERALGERLRLLQAEAERAEAEARLAGQRASLAQRTAERYRQLATDGFVSELQAQARQEEWLELRAREEAARRNADALRREQQGLQAEQVSWATQLQAEQAQLRRNRAQLAQEVTENEARRQFVLAAPAAGTVTALHVAAGAQVLPGQALIALVPASLEGSGPRQTAGAAGVAAAVAPLEAELYAPSRTAGFVRPGQPAWLRVAAFPYQKFGMTGGTVVGISHTPVAPQDLPMGQQQALLAANQSSEPLYRIRVALHSQAVQAWGESHALKPGMSLQADLVQERRAVWEFLLEPLLAAGRRLAP